MHHTTAGMKLLILILFSIFIVSSAFSQENIAQISTDSAGTLTPDNIPEHPEEIPADKLSAKTIIKNAYRYKVEQLSQIKTYDLHMFTRSSIKYHIIDNPVQLITDYTGGDFKVMGVGETEQFDYYRRHTGEKYYDKKIQVKSRRQTELLNKLYGFPYSINMYDDEINLLNATIPGPLTEDCLDIYDYKLLDVDSSGGKKVYEIGIREKVRYMPGFRGIIRVEDSTFAMVEADLTTNYATNIPLVKDIRLRQEFDRTVDSVNNVHYHPRNFLLDVNASYVGALKLRLQTYSETRDIKMNSKQKGVEYDDFNIVVEPKADMKPKQYWEQNGLIENDTMASNELKKIYEKKLDKKSFVTFTGSGLRFGDHLTWNYLYAYTFNRTEGNHLELNLTYERNYGRLVFNTALIYGTADEKAKYHLDFLALPRRNLDLSLTGEFHSNLVPLFKQLNWVNYLENTISTLFTHKDRVDRYMGAGFKFGAAYRFVSQFTMNAEFMQEKQTSAYNNTNYSFYRKYENYSINPLINEGMMRKLSVGVTIDFNRYRMIDWGDGDIARSRMTALPVLEFKYGYSGKRLVQSDFEMKDYSLRVTGSVRFSSFIKILYKAGAYLKYGTVPYQELVTLDPKFLGFPNDISFICPDYSEFLGDRVMFFNFENEFGKIFPFDIPVLSSITLLGDFGFGKTWITESNRDLSPSKAFKSTDGVYMEAGFGLTRILELGTLRYGWRLNNFKEGSDTFLFFDIGIRM